ncbi:hypothetical protein HPB52_007406 [Rhipicephalus sanguineus]|uniref:Uncharacterized protein n=1 Tax=Rhipicephalus sanguineus TaxID=34632 RepID=A0A9D4QLS3_RHISA|nr:hypothetical protein HPB52_007406 [Rhipicephalus sanguineus]
MFNDLLRVACYGKYGDLIGGNLLRSWRQQAAQSTKVQWRSTLAHLPKGHNWKPEAHHDPVIIGDVVVPAEVNSVLKMRPKFSLEPHVPTHELLDINRRVANKTEKEQQETCPLEGVDSLLASTKDKPTQRRKQVQRLRSSGYSDPLLMATAESLLQKVKGQGRRKATHKNDTRPEQPNL